MSLSAAKLALAVKRARAQSGAPELLNSEPIAIIGMGCRLPGNADSPDAFWTLLRDGVDAIGAVPPGRWASSIHLPACQGGFLNDVDLFDAGFFGIPSGEAERMDPQHRLLMEVIWESLSDARLAPESLAGARNGVFVAVYNNDYLRLQFSHPGNINAYTSTGTSHSTAVGRISFLLDWKGPSVAIDTACSSSLVALHMACQSLRAGECQMAVAGGVSLILAPEELISLTRLGMLAQDWRCKTFDSRADGFVPGEGCGIVVLKRLTDALRDGDSIRAIIRGTAVNQDGRSTVLTAPNGLSQQVVIQSALENAQLTGEDISYVEAHGTGTALGDPIEVEALAEVLGRGAAPCVLGSVKTNFGHLEAAAGVSGLIKTALALEHQQIPRSLHFQKLNPHIQLEGSRLVIADRAIAWLRGQAPRYAGVSSFGFGGTNAHAIMEEAPSYSVSRREPVVPPVWKRRRYWCAGAPPPEERNTEHPLLGRRLSSPAFESTVFENHLGAESPPYLGDHRPGGEVLLPMTACIEMFLAASGAGSLEDLMVQEPLQLPAEGSRPVQVIGEGNSLRLYSQHDGNWRLHATARTGATPPSHSAVNLEDLRRGVTGKQDVEGFYAGLEARGLCFGPAFRLIRELWIGSGEALARIRACDRLEGYHFHPALLDGCLQALGALLPDDGVYLPFGLRRFAILNPPVWGDLWSRATLRPGNGNALSADVRIFDADGQPVAVVEGLSLRKPASARNKECLCEMVWQPQPRKATPKIAVTGTWLIFEDAGGIGASVVAQLQAEGAQCLTVRPEEDFHQLVSASITGVLHLWSLDATPPAELTDDSLQREERLLCGSVLQLVKRLAQTGGQPPLLWIATRNAQRVDAGQREVSIVQAPVWGLARTIRREHPDLNCITIDLDCGPDTAGRLLEEIRSPDGEPQIAWRGACRMVPRLVDLSEQPQCVRLQSGRGLLEELRWEPSTRRKPEPGEVEIRVAAAGLNFRDVLNALGEYPGDAGPLGSECAGWIEQVGEGVTGLAPGDEVVAVARASFSCFVTTAADLVMRKPSRLRLDEAAALPIAYVTARYALAAIGKLQAGQRILIHAAAGGVGLAAVEEAQRVGAEIFATAGNDEKRAWLRSLGVRYIMNSRTLDYGDEILALTGRRGVDLVLNSLSDEHTRESLKVLAPGGTFLELGKRGIWDPQRVAALRPDVHYAVIEWGEEYQCNPESISGIYRSVIEDVERGLLKPLPCRAFEKRETVNAFRWMAQGRHIGKIVVRLESVPRPLRSDAAYLITGGLGALGLRVAQWMAQHGAGELVLVGRSTPDEHARSAIQAAETAGARVVVRRADISRKEDIEPIIEEILQGKKPLKGIIHAAGILDDGVLSQLDWQRFAQVMAPKVEGSWRLHQLTAHLDLDFFIMFSSLASLVGSPGQGNYAAANAFLDALAHYRKALGLAALSINWGPWQGEGMAARPESAGWQRSFRAISPLPFETGLKLFEKLLKDGDRTQVAAFLLRSAASLQDLEFGDPESGDTESNAASRSSSQSSSREPQAVGLQARDLPRFLREEAAKIMGLQDAGLLSLEDPLFEAGLDSLMAVEFRNVLAAAFGRSFSSTLLFDFPTLRQLAAFLAGDRTLQPVAVDKCLADEIRDLDEWEAEALLKSELGRRRN